ncbi:MAG: MMPL family transporter, partial [Deltaproteobacteria bacterium]|nr:MMPL family transporter [Deltaproteobacteria bacterium]
MNFRDALARFVLKHRLFFLVGTLAVTAFFGAQIPKVVVESPLIDLFPKNHEFVQTYKDYEDIFGGANLVVMDIEVDKGTIFNPTTLGKIRKITKELELLPGINNYQVLSLAQRKVKNITVDASAGFTAVPLMWPDVPKKDEDIARLVKLVHTITRVHGKLVSRDDKAALIVAGFFKDQIDEKEIYSRLHAIAGEVEDDNTSVHMIGRPVLVGFVLDHYSQLIYLFIATIASIILLLLAYFRDLRGMMIPVTTAVLSAIWGIGLLGLLGYNFDPLILVVPFVISARALSHSVQLIERYMEEYTVDEDRIGAATRTFSGLFEPGIVGIVTDALGILMVWLTPIPLMQKLAVMGSFWVLSIIFTDMIFNPVLLSYLPPPKKEYRTGEGWIASMLGAVGRWCMGPNRWTVLILTGVLLAVGGWYASKLVVGDIYPGTPMLWPDSEYNRDTEAIGRKFNNTDVINVIVEGDKWNAVKSPDVLEKIAFLQRRMETLPEVGGSLSIVDMIPPIIRALHGGDPRWELIPTDQRESGFFLEMIYGASEPGDLSRFVTPNSMHSNVSIYLKDHKGVTLQKVVRELRDYVKKNPMEGAKFRLAGGYGGLLAAVNEVVAISEARVTILAFSFVFLICAFAYRSFVAGLMFMIPLLLSNYLTYALMGLRGIGLDVNALPVVALGVGLGVDYGLYIVSRIREEYEQKPDLPEAIVTAMSTAGKAVLLTAGTMVFGVVFWTFSFLRFQADMGLLLVFWMCVSMTGGLVLLPTLV